MQTNRRNNVTPIQRQVTWKRESEREREREREVDNRFRKRGRVRETMKLSTRSACYECWSGPVSDASALGFIEPWTYHRTLDSSNLGSIDMPPNSQICCSFIQNRWLDMAVDLGDWVISKFCYQSHCYGQRTALQHPNFHELIYLGLDTSTWVKFSYLAIRRWYPASCKGRNYWRCYCKGLASFALRWNHYRFDTP